MKLREEDYQKISDCFPRPRKPAKISNLDVLNAVLYLAESGSGWRNLPREYGDWHVIYVRVSRWTKKGILQAAFLRLQQLGIVQIQAKITAGSALLNQDSGLALLSKGQGGDGMLNFMWAPNLGAPED